MRQVVASIDVETAAPEQQTIPRWLIVFGFAAAPSAWLAQLVIDYGLASYACFPVDQPQPHVIEGFGWVWWMLTGLNVAGLIVSIAATAIAHANLRASWRERGGPLGDYLDAGDRRNSFLSVFGLWSGAWFLVAIFFDTIMVFWVPLCTT
jgi:hypothetical protein